MAQKFRLFLRSIWLQDMIKFWSVNLLQLQALPTQYQQF